MLNAVKLTETSQPLQIIYASQTGNGEQLANRFGQAFGSEGLPASVLSFLDVTPASLRKTAAAVFVISTHGEGDPPDDALDLFDYLRRERTPKLQGLRFRILALGDSSYVRFCEAGRELERLLLANGAQPFADRIECDLDYSQNSDRFLSEILEYSLGASQSGQTLTGLAANAEPANTAADIPRAGARLQVVAEASPWSRQRPFPATVESVDRLTTPDSSKDTHHVVLSIAGSGIRYQPGDSLAVQAVNDPELVSELLSVLRLAPATRVERDGAVRTLRDWLTGHLEITRLAPATVEAWSGFVDRPFLSKRLQSLQGDELAAFIERRQLLDLAREYPARIDATSLVSLLRPMTPRSYSIASSQDAVDDQVHLTVVTHEGGTSGQPRYGVASRFLNHRLQPGDPVGVSLEPNARFSLPSDRSRPIIMIAAGTGIAPFRAFLQQLQEEGVSPRTWLIFGNPKMRSDFLYQSEWLKWRASGLLDRIDTAFSRDQAEKRYVQHVVSERIARISEWLEWGASLFLCGSRPMGQAVEAALAGGLASQRGISEEQARESLSRLRREKRFLKELY